MPEPERNYGPPPWLPPMALSIWAIRQIERATGEGEIRAAMRVLMANGRDEPQRSFIRYVRKRLLEVGAKLPHTSQ